MKSTPKISARILADSMNVVTGNRLTTFQVRVPKWLLAEINTHRALSRNFASSRAIPAKIIRKQILEDPFIPVYFGANQKGMQSKEELSGWKLNSSLYLWRLSRYPACFAHWIGEKLGLHKQIINRILEPWMWADGIISATEWNNFFALRNHSDAQPEFRELARQMQKLYESSNYELLEPGEWHLPFIDEDTKERQKNYNDCYETVSRSLRMISSARCARVSFLLRDGKVSDLDSDIKLCERLIGSFPGHWSPLEHPAQALEKSERCGNYIGFKQMRKFYPLEHGGDYGS